MDSSTAAADLGGHWSARGVGVLAVAALAWTGCGLVLDSFPAQPSAPDAGMPVSCADLYATDPSLPDGDYVIHVDGVATTVHCGMSFEGGGWTESVDLSPVDDGCPTEWLYDDSVEGCYVDRPDCTGDQRTFLVTPPIPEYREVYGYVRGIQRQTPDAFSVSGATLDGPYVDGVSITTGDPRRHVWTFAAGLHKPTGRSNNACPCDNGPPPPAFVGDHWTCETGNDRADFVNMPIWYPMDILWDADGDAHGAGCAPVTEPGWFHATLDTPSQDPLEVRIMMDQCDDNVGIVALQLYVR